MIAENVNIYAHFSPAKFKLIANAPDAEIKDKEYKLHIVSDYIKEISYED